MYGMIEFYCESVSDGKQNSTMQHHADLLTRIFDQMREFGVVLNEESISGLTGASVQRWFNAAKKGKKETTINNYVATLNPFLRWAHTIYPEIPDVSNVLKFVRLPDPDKLPEDQRPKDKYLSDEEIALLLAIPKKDTPKKKRDRAVIATLIGTGLRAMELCQLTVGSVAGQPETVRVRRKGGAYKDVQVANFAYKYIRAYLATRPGAKPDEPLFLTTRGTPCDEHQLYMLMRSLQDHAGISEDRQRGVHVFRHTFVSSVEKIGGGAVARDLAGHKSLAITNRYDHSTAAQRRDAVNALQW